VNLYAVLGVEPGASADEIRRAYRQAALLWHPDRNPDPQAPAVFHAVQEAYEGLRDPARRRSYDRAVGSPPQPRRVRFADEARPAWVPPEGEHAPLRFVPGRGWTSLQHDPPTAQEPPPARAPQATTRRWSRDERLSLAVAAFAAVAGAVAIAIAPMFS
jgi:curved DNA-binding protein CbpA